MHRNAVRQRAFFGVAFLLLVIPKTGAFAAGLRDQAVSYRTQGYEAQRRGDKDAALSWYQKAAALDPTYPTPHNDIGVLYEEQGRLEEAGRAYQEALALNPNYLEPHANLAMLYEHLGEKEKAIYHWMKRYQLGDPYDPGTARAEDRLLALGILKTHPGLKGKIYNSRRIAEGEWQAHDQSRKEFHALTEQRDDWP